MNQLYPLRFTPIVKNTIWGGNRLKEVLNKEITSGGKAAESWEISAVKDNLSVVSNGFLAGNNLQELTEVYMGDLVGDTIFEKFGIEFPLLLKFIDANKDLSIQVHPDDELARKRHHAFGKTEMWYVLEAERGAELITGFNRPLDKKTYLDYFSRGSLPDILNREKVVAGDVFFIPAGRVHSIGPGILLAEIQETSDITYRIYDWDRVDENGNGRPLHTDLALDALDFKFHKKYKTTYKQTINQSNPLVRCSHFTTNILPFNKYLERDYSFLDSFVVYMCVDGRFRLGWDDGETIVKKGESILIPAVLKEISLSPEPEASLLEIYIQKI